MQDFRTLQVWQKAHQLTLDVYHLSEHLPADERYGLTNQIRRSCASIPTNIAEGCGRNTQSDLARFLHIAMGSASELEYQLLLVHDLGYIESEHYNDLNGKLIEVRKMLNTFIQRVRTTN